MALKTVLWVNGDLGMRMLYAPYLREAQYRVWLSQRDSQAGVANVKDALMVLLREQRQPDALVTDWDVLGYDTAGYEAGSKMPGGEEMLSGTSQYYMVRVVRYYPDSPQANSVIGRAIRAAGGKRVVPFVKPFSVYKLIAILDDEFAHPARWSQPEAHRRRK